MNRKTRPTEHMFIPDTQVKPGVNTDHIEAAGNYCAEKRPDRIIIAGDWWDFPSLSGYEKKGSKYWDSDERTYAKDVAAGNEAMWRFLNPIRKLRKVWNPTIDFTEGNHEFRRERAMHEDPALKGTLDALELVRPGMRVHPYLEMVDIDGILYSHVFMNPQSMIRGVLGGSIDNRLNKIKQSFTQGHQQVKLWGSQFTSAGRELCGLVAGAFYSHEEDYMGPQGKNYWRGCVYKHEVQNGRYDPMFLSLGYLVRNWL